MSLPVWLSSEEGVDGDPRSAQCPDKRYHRALYHIEERVTDFIAAFLSTLIALTLLILVLHEIFPQFLNP